MLITPRSTARFSSMPLNWRSAADRISKPATTQGVKYLNNLIEQDPYLIVKLITWTLSKSPPLYEECLISLRRLTCNPIGEIYMISEIQEIEHGRERFLDLLLLADPSLGIVQRYLAKGHLFVFFDEGKACGVVHLIPQTSNTMEVKNIAVKEESQGRGYGKMFLHYALDFCQRQRYEKVIVGTGNSSINNFAFYQKAGFRFLSIMRNFFTDHYDQPIFEHGIQCRDMILLEVDFANQS